MTIPVITLNCDVRCAECGKKSAVAENGLCLPCTTKAIQGKPMKSENGRSVRTRFLDMREKLRTAQGK